MRPRFLKWKIGFPFYVVPASWVYWRYWGHRVFYFLFTVFAKRLFWQSWIFIFEGELILCCVVATKDKLCHYFCSDKSKTFTGAFWFLRQLLKSQKFRCNFSFYESTNIVHSLIYHASGSSIVQPRALIKPPQFLLSFPWTPVGSSGHAASLLRPWTLDREGPAGLGE